MPSPSAVALEDPSAPDFSERKTESLAALIESRLPRAPERILVVGCGNGVEAAVLATYFGAQVTGIDKQSSFDTQASKLVTLQVGDAMQLEFAAGSFDLVYSFHALEHFPDPLRALKEMRRVLVPGGHYCVGTPNRARLVGYLGSKVATLGQKIQWNLQDWNARLHGRFRNELGAHAGFLPAELRKNLHEVFGTAEDITLEYYLRQYPHRVDLIGRMVTLGVAGRLFPCIYFIGKRTT